MTDEDALAAGSDRLGHGLPGSFADTRYNRQELMPQIGPEGQARLGQARVACIGAGGVKSPMLYYLAAAGIGHLRIIDFDTVELSNLNRQILYGTADIGRPKAEAAAARLRGLNDEITIEPVAARVATANVAALFGRVRHRHRRR